MLWAALWTGLHGKALVSLANSQQGPGAREYQSVTLCSGHVSQGILVNENFQTYKKYKYPLNQ